MILPFSTQMNGKPTYFVEKIHSGLIQNDLLKEFKLEFAPKKFDVNILGECEPKLHTIREDKNDRWQEGKKIDFFINCRQKDMFRFAPVLPVVSTQKVDIDYSGSRKYHPWVWVDGKSLNIIEIEKLAKNDGFDTVEDFFTYFKEDFKGKIIHWTDLKY